jgi:tetratricopeptide repeat protein 21B
MQVHMAALNKDQMYTVKGMIQLDPDFLLSIAKELLELAGSEPVPPGEPPAPALTKATKVLAPVSSVAPGLIEAQLLMAKSRYLSRDFEGAQQVLTEAIQGNPSQYTSHMLMTQILIEIEKFTEANASLEQALSHNFEIREQPTYYILKAKIHEKVTAKP